jgi:peptidyl-dipeptidase A
MQRNAALLALLVPLGCATSKAAAVPSTPEGARAFVATLNKDLKELWAHQMQTDWVKETYITDDTEALSAKANEAVLAYTSQAILTAARFDGLALDPDTQRQLHLLKVSSALPAPSDPAERAEIAAIASKLSALYGKGKYCPAKPGAECLDINELTRILAESRSYETLLDAWQGWHSIAKEMRPLYQRFVELSNKGAQEIGFADTGQLWRSSYDMTPVAFEAETDRLWAQLEPLYQDLHCYVRGKLQAKYGKDRVPDQAPIPAHLLGNLWAQEWGNIYPLVAPPEASGTPSTDVSAALKAKGYDAVKMVKTAEGFFRSLGLTKLPDTFWERSQFTKPRDREVVCHASAWSIDFANDLRVKMCIKIDLEDLHTIHHELGHDYYYYYYQNLPALYQSGANEGFHEAIGDALALSVTPSYLVKLGILDAEPPKDEQALIRRQLRDALDKIAFLPFGKLIDQWRWDVFSKKIAPENYNAAWWALRRKYQGVDAPVARTEEDFDPGAKYHIPANFPYTRYFLARILQFQFHRALCRTAGHSGPLHECSIYGNTAAGAKLRAMLELGASKPWPEALYAITGERQMDAGALLEYFAPLTAWLKEQNKGARCGW